MLRKAVLALVLGGIATLRCPDGWAASDGGAVRPEAATASDRGALPRSTPLEHILIQLNLPSVRDDAADAFVAAQLDPASSDYHHWLTAEQYGRRFGAAAPDVDRIAAWLRRQGLAVNVVYPGGLIDISGFAGTVADAFHTEIHVVSANGVQHIANLTEPRVPRALASAVAGIVSLHDFMPHPMFVARPDFNDDPAACSSLIGQCRYMAPPDLATIYNLTPLFRAGITGAGQKIAVVEDSNMIPVFSPPNDWTNFRNNFGLSAYKSGSFVQVHPAPQKGANNCANPGAAKNGDYVEASIDAEWASAAAPGAQIVLASCGTTKTTFGGYIALANLINEPDPPRIVSLSFGDCEAAHGAAANKALSALYRQAAAEGISIFVAAGDFGPAACDTTAASNASVATHGVAVNAWASPPYAVAVGGTDFADVLLGTASTYWNATNSKTGGSARSYIPEMPWNTSCASTALTAWYFHQGIGESVPYGPNGWCQNATSDNYISDGAGTTASGGGPSGCATGKPAQAGIVGGTCRGYPKPAWQKIAGNPADGVRDVPDVAIFAGSLTWGHIYVVCANKLGTNVSNCNKTYPASLLKAGGTSFGAPIMAGIQALVNQKTKRNWGNPDPVYYQLARSGQGTGAAACDATLGNKVGASCLFHDVTVGDNDVHCSGKVDCFGTPPSGEFGGGVLSLSSTAYRPAFRAASGWDFASGLGSVDAARLVDAWPDR